MNRFLRVNAYADNRVVICSLAAVFVQAVAATYYIADGVDDIIMQLGRGINVELAMECLVAAALLIATVMGARQLRQSLRDAAHHETALQVAKGAMSDLIAVRFGQWKLSQAEADVALFALKGCSVADISTLRNSAEGTVRSQLSQVYAKASVTSQVGLISHFIEELIEARSA